MRNGLLFLAVFVSMCSLSFGFQADSKKDVVQPKNAEPQQQGPHPQPSPQPSIPAQATDKDADHRGGQNQQKQEQNVRVVSIPEVRVNPSKDSIDKWMLFCTAVLTLVGIVGT